MAEVKPPSTSTVPTIQLFQQPYVLASALVFSFFCNSLIRPPSILGSQHFSVQTSNLCKGKACSVPGWDVLT